MLLILLFASLILAAPSPQANTLNRIALPFRSTFARSTGDVNGPALLESLQKTLNKYHSNVTIPGASANKSLQRRLTTENLIDQVEEPDFDEQYYGPTQVGYGTTQQIFTVQFDTGSSDVFIPGPQCTSDEGCSLNKKYDEGGVYQGRTAAVQYGSGYIEGDIYTDSVNVAGLVATNQGIISLTQASGFDTSASDGLLGMGFTALSASGYTTFFENLIAQNKVASPEFSFYLGRAASGTAQRSSLCLGCRDPSRYTGPTTQVPVTEPAYWQIVLNAITVAGVSAGPSTHGQAIIDTGTTLVLAPTAAAYAIFDLVPGSFALPVASDSDSDDSSEQTFFAYPCSTSAEYMPAIRFGGKAFAINPLDFNFGLLTSSFARLVGDEALAAKLEEQELLTVKLEVKGEGEAKGEGEGEGEGEAKAEAEAHDGSVQNCVAALVGTDGTPGENLFVVGDAFLKNWYTTFSYGSGGGKPSVSFAEAV